MLIEDLMRKLTEAHMRDPEATVCMTLKRTHHGGWETYMRISNERTGSMHEEVRMPADYFEIYSGQDMDAARLQGQIQGMERMREALQPATRLNVPNIQPYPTYVDGTKVTLGTGVTTSGTLKGSVY